MKKTTQLIVGLATFAVVAIPAMPVFATTGDNAEVTPVAEQVTGVKSVKTAEEFDAALADTAVTQIDLADDITLTKQTNIVRAVDINGNGHKITLKVAEGQKGNYVLQAYNTTVTLKDVTLTGGAYGGLLVNGSVVTLAGKIDVSGNALGGIEISNGQANPDAKLELKIEGEIINTTEAKGKPTFWTDTADKVTVKYDGIEAAVKQSDNGQVTLYLNKDNAPTTDEYEALDVNDFRVTPIPDVTEPEPTDPVIPEEPKDEQDKITAPNTGVQVNASTAVLAASSLAIIAGAALVARRAMNK